MSDTLPTAYLKTLLRIARDEGGDVDRILARAGLDFDPLDESSPGYQTKVSAMQYTQVYRQLIELGQNEILGLAVDKAMTPGTFRMMCYCVISSNRLGQAIERVIEFHQTFFDYPQRLHFSLERERVALGYRFANEPKQRVNDEGLALRYAYGLSFWHRFFGWLSGSPIPLASVHLVGSAPGRQDRYERLFGAPVQFSQANDFIYFGAAVLDRPVMHTEHTLNEFLRSAPYPLLVMNPRSSDSDFSAQVKALIGQDFSHGFPSFGVISSALGVSAPTLR
ncbi:MAG: AraC family transcriptional regulator, partial [Pseudomonadota bacterium]